MYGIGIKQRGESMFCSPQGKYMKKSLTLNKEKVTPPREAYTMLWTFKLLVGRRKETTVSRVK